MGICPKGHKDKQLAIEYLGEIPMDFLRRFDVAIRPWRGIIDPS